MTNDAFSWKQPVHLELHCGLARRFSDAHDTLDFLEQEWPTRRGPAYERALRHCRIALSDSRALGEARSALIAAAREAGLATVRWMGDR